MGKNMRQESIQLHNGNSGCMNKFLHALNRRHRWQNVRKVLPNKRQGSGKQIIDGGTSEATTTNTCQPPPDVHNDPKGNKPKIEQAVHTTNTEGSSKSSKSSKKFRIRSLISDEMAKRRGKHHRRRRSPSPSRSPRRQTNTIKQLKNDIRGAENEKPPTKVTESNCENPSITKKKRKCDICAAMLTVSYLRQKGHSNENRVKENLDGNGQPAASLELQVSGGHDAHYMHSHAPLHSRKRLTKSFSIPIRLGSSKRRDFEVEELKDRLRKCNDIQTAKEKFILPMNQFRDIGLPKPMLTRPESFKTPSTTSKKDKKQTTINSKTLKQKIGFTAKDSKKEKRRILMDAVFHKIPYGRRSSKDPKKMSPGKLKSNSTSSSGSDRSSVEKSHLKKTSSTSEAMSKYRRLLSQTSTRDQEKIQLSDHRTKLFVAGGEQSFGLSGKTHKRIRSLPNINPSDFTHSQEFPVKPIMDLHLSISGALFDDQKSLDPFIYGERLNVYTATKKVVGKKTKLLEKGKEVDENLGTSNLQEKLDRKDFSAATESAAEETKLVDKDESNNENIGADQNPPNHEEIIHDQNEPRVDSGNTSKETILVDKDEAIDQNLEVSRDASKSDHQGEPRVTIEVEKDKNFNDILGMFKKASDERTKQNQEADSIVVAGKVAKNTVVEKDSIKKNLEVGQKTLDNQEKNKSDLPTDYEDNKDESVNTNLEDGSITIDHQENDNSPLGSCDKGEIQAHQGFQVQTSFVKDIRYSPLKDFSNENKQHGFSTSSRPSIANKQPNNMKINARNSFMMEDGFLHLDINTFKDNPEFQFVKEVLERSGFLENQFLGEWYSSYQPIDPLLFEEVETNFLQSKILEDLDLMKDEEATQKIINDHHLLLFDIINEALLHLQNKTFTYCPHPLTYRSKVRPMPVGHRLLEEVWNIVTMYLNWKPEQLQPSLDDVLSHDLEKGDGWMNLQNDAEFVGIELEEMLADDLLDELVFDDLLM